MPADISPVAEPRLAVPLLVVPPVDVPPPVVCAVTTLGANKVAAAIVVRIRIAFSCLLETESFLSRECSSSSVKTI